MGNVIYQHHVCIRLSKSQYKRLVRLILIENKTKSELLRDIIEEYQPKFNLG
jgi:predicted DNA-binding protein